MKVFLLAGQSNMQGCGNFGKHTTYEDDRILNFKDDVWRIAKEPLHNFTCKVWTDGGAGIGMSFGLRLLKEFPEWEIGFVPCAVSGSSLEQWQPGAELFEHAVTKTRQALSNCESEFAGIIWHQGEADSAALETAETYAERFELTINAFRREFSNENLPVIAGALGTFLSNRSDHSYFQIVNNALKQTATVFIPSEGLTATDRNDNLHFDTKSLRKFGIRYAESYIDLMKN